MNRTQKIRFIYGIVLTVMTLVVGIAFIVAVSQVYYGGIKENPDYPFEIERIKEHILVPFVFLLCWIAAIIGGAVISIVFPLAEKKNVGSDSLTLLNRYKDRMPTSGGEEYSAAKDRMEKYEKIRMIIWGVAFAFFPAVAIVIFVYAFNITHYHADALKEDILNLVKNVLTWTAAAVAVGIAAAVVDVVLLKREIAEAKTAIAKGDKSAAPVTKEVKKGLIVVATVSASVITGIALIAYIVAPFIVQAAFTVSQTVIYVIVFVVAALTIVGFTVYNIFKRYIPDKLNGILLLVSRIVVGVVAVTFIIVGVLNGGANDVLVKAINICTECIGLG